MVDKYKYKYALFREIQKTNKKNCLTVNLEK